MEYYIVSREGKYWEFDSWDMVMKTIIKRDIYYRMGTSFKETRYKFYSNFEDIYYLEVNFIIMDKYDRVVSFSRVKDNYNWYVKLLEKENKQTYRMWNGFKVLRDNIPWIYSKYRNIKWRYREDPVPGVNNKQWGFCNFYKTSCNLQEKKRYFEDSNYCKIRKRHGYSYNSFFDPWSDVPKSRSMNSSKTWKLKKIKKQWMKNYRG